MVERQTNWLAQMRVDLSLLRAMESSVAGDFDVSQGSILAGRQPLIVSGFKLSNIIGAAASIQVLVAGATLINYNASESGSMFAVPAGRANETLNSTNPNVSGSWTASSTNFVGVDIIRSADPTTADTLQFLQATTLTEVPKTVPLARTLNYRFVISTTSFSAQPNLVPIAKVVTDSGNNIVSIQDCRNILGRVAPGGDFAAVNQGYMWPGGRAENLTGDVFSGGDKVIGSVREWMQAAMTRIWETSGGEYWYSSTADRNVTIIWNGTAFSNGENLEWTGTNLHWRGLRFIFDNSTGFFNDIQDQTGDVAGQTDLADGWCLYVDLDRTQNRANAYVVGGTYAVGQCVSNDTAPVKIYECVSITTGITSGGGGPTGTGSGIVDGGVTWNYVSSGSTGLLATKSNLSALGPGTVPGSRQVLAWRVGSQIFTKGWRYPLGGTLTVPATATSLGTVKLSRNDTTPATPIVISDAGGTIVAPAVGTVTGLTSTGHNVGYGFYGIGGATGVGVGGIGGATGGAGGYFVGTGAASTGCVGAGAGSGFGGIFTGGATDATGVVGNGGGTNGRGIDGIGAGTGVGVQGTGGGSSADGVYGVGGSTDGVGVEGLGTGAGYGVLGTGGAGSSATGVFGQGGSTNGRGVFGQGAGSGAGVAGSGAAGAGTGAGVSGTGGNTSGDGVTGTASGGNSNGVSGTGHGTGAGVKGTGTGTGPSLLGAQAASGPGAFLNGSADGHRPPLQLNPVAGVSVPASGDIWIDTTGYTNIKSAYGTLQLRPDIYRVAPTLNDTWTVAGVTEAITYSFTSGSRVFIEGQVKAGAGPSASLLFTLPGGLWPVVDVVRMCTLNHAGTYSILPVNIHAADGTVNVTTGYVSTDILTFHMSFSAI